MSGLSQTPTAAAKRWWFSGPDNIQGLGVLGEEFVADRRLLFTEYGR